jgi:hypothetical protein
MGTLHRTSTNPVSLAVLLLGVVPAVVCASNAQLIEKALHTPAKAIFAPSRPVKKPEVTLQGTLEQYIRAVVHTNGFGEITKTSVVTCTRNPAEKCVRIVGDACPKKKKPTEDCEGMDLTAIVNVNGKPKLDAAYGPDPKITIRDQADIEKSLQEAP